MATVNTGPDLIQAINNALSYTIGNCTRWVAENLPWIPAGLGNADQWLANAQAKGLPTGSVPQVGSVAVWNTGQFGHVAEVTKIIPGGFQVSEENWLGTGITDVRDITGSSLNGLLGFIYAPASAAASAGASLNSGVQGAAGTVLGLPEAIAGLPASIGHGVANAGVAVTHNAATAVKNNIVPLVVALAVALVIFGGDESKNG